MTEIVEASVTGQFHIDTMDGTDESLDQLKSLLKQYGCNAFRVSSTYEVRSDQMIYRVQGYVTVPV